MDLPNHIVVYDGVYYPGNIGTMIRTNAVFDPTMGNVILRSSDNPRVDYTHSFTCTAMRFLNTIFQFLFGYFIEVIPYHCGPVVFRTWSEKRFLDNILHFSMLKRWKESKNVCIVVKNHDCKSFIRSLIDNGYRVIALENNSNYPLIPLNQIPQSEPTEKVALIVGSEKDGICPEILKMCNVQAYIPTTSKFPLSVSTAHGIAIYTLFGKV